MRKRTFVFIVSHPGSERGVSLDRRRQKGLAVEEHEGLCVQHLLLVHADDDAVVHLEPGVAQLDEGDVCQGKHGARLRGRGVGARAMFFWLVDFLIPPKTCIILKY